jgi:protein SCO1
MSTLGIDEGIEALDGFVGGWRFPTLALSILLAWPTLLLSVLLLPTDAGPMAAFAEQFKVWCFGYDPATGSIETVYVVLLIVNPLVLVSVVLLGWWRVLGDAWELKRASVIRSAVGGVAFVVLMGAGLTTMAVAPAVEVDLSFPAEALRTKHIPPEFDLVDQDGNQVTSADMVGHVTLLTSVYASCPHTCPLILTEAKAAMAAMDPALAQDVQILAVTMDPANDGPEAMGALGAMHGLTTPQYKLLSGDVEPVEALLDKLGVARQRDPETGVITHVNLFVLVDRTGRIAYRIALGTQDGAWLKDALEVLSREPAEPIG